MFMKVVNHLGHICLNLKVNVPSISRIRSPYSCLFGIQKSALDFKKPGLRIDDFLKVPSISKNQVSVFIKKSEPTGPDVGEHLYRKPDQTCWIRALDWMPYHWWCKEHETARVRNWICLNWAAWTDHQQPSQRALVQAVGPCRLRAYHGNPCEAWARLTTLHG